MERNVIDISATTYDSDLSDSEFEAVKDRFVTVLLPKYGKLWHDLLASSTTTQKKKDDGVDENENAIPHENTDNRCTNDCCKNLTNFVPPLVLLEKQQQEEVEQEEPMLVPNFIKNKATSCISPIHDEQEAYRFEFADDTDDDDGRDDEPMRHEEEKDLKETTAEDEEDDEEEESNSSVSSGSGESTVVNLIHYLPDWSPPPAAAAAATATSQNDENNMENVSSSLSPLSSPDRQPTKKKNQGNVIHSADANNKTSEANKKQQHFENNNNKVIDLIDSSSSSSDADDEGSDDGFDRNMELAKKIPASFILSGSSSDESDKEAEWNDHADDDDGCQKSTSDSAPERERKNVTDSIKKKRPEIVILSSDEEEEETKSSNRKPITKHRPIPTSQQRKQPVVSKTWFRRNRERIASETFKVFDNLVFGNRLLPSTQLVWSNKLRTTAGLTRLHRTSRPGVYVHRTATIELSSKILDDSDRLRATLLHEMCHAAAWILDANSKPPHGPCFQKWAKTAMKQVPDVVVTTTHDYEIEYKYAWACQASECGAVIKRHSRSVNVERHVCGRCQGRLVEIDVAASRHAAANNNNNKRPMMLPRKKAPPSAYNLFVKEHSAAVRRRLEEANETSTTGTKVTQQDVMKECARLWREKNNKTE